MSQLNPYHAWMKQREVYENGEFASDAYSLFAFDFYNNRLSKLSEIAKLRVHYPGMTEEEIQSMAKVLGLVKGEEED